MSNYHGDLCVRDVLFRDKFVDHATKFKNSNIRARYPGVRSGEHYQAKGQMFIFRKTNVWTTEGNISEISSHHIRVQQPSKPQD